MAVGNFRENAATQAAYNKQKQYINKDGSFKAPFRKAGESYSKYQKRVSQAQLESGLFPRLKHASTLTDRTNKRQYLSIQKEIEKLEASLTNIEAAKGTEREYSMSLGKDKVVKRLSQLKLKQDNNPYKDTLAIQQSKELLAKNSQQQNVEVAEKIVNGTVTEKDKVSANTNAFADGAEFALFNVDQFKEYNPDLQYLNRTQDQNVAYDKGEKFQTDAESLTGGKAKEAIETLKIKSDVHTIDPETGEAVGVLTRSQRKAFEARDDVRRELLKIQKSGKGLRTYKEGGPQYGG